MKFYYTILLLFIGMLLPAASFAQMGPQVGDQSIEQLKESPAGSLVIRLIDGINEKEKVNDTFVRDLFSENLIEKNGTEGLKKLIIDDIRAVDGHMDVYRVERKSMLEYTVFATSKKNNEWLKLTLVFAGRRDSKIDNLMLDALLSAPEGINRDIIMNEKW